MFKEILTDFMYSKGVKGMDLADHLKTSSGYVTDLKKGRTFPSEERLSMIIEFLRLNADEKRKMEEAWSLDRATNSFKAKYAKLEKDNEEMLKVLKSMSKEKDAMDELDELKKSSEKLKSLKKIYEEINATESTDVELLLVMVDLAIKNCIEKGNYEYIEKKLKPLKKAIEEGRISL